MKKVSKSKGSPKSSVSHVEEPSMLTQQLREMFVLMVALHLSKRVGTDLETRELLELGRIVKDIAQNPGQKGQKGTSLQEWQRIEKAARIVAGGE